MTKVAVSLFLILSLLANVAAFLAIKQLYLSANQVRLDPLQLGVYSETAPSKIPGKQRVVFFGDSRALSWPAPVDASLSEFEFINRGIGNQTSAQIRLRYEQHVAPLQADIIVLQLCVNDLKVIPLKPAMHTDIVSQCQNNLQVIIQQARQQDATVILSTVFPLGEVPMERRLIWSGAVAQAINEVNAFIATQADDGVIIFPGYGILLGEVDMIRPEYSRDLLHLNARGYAALNDGLAAFLVKLK